jgi:hypothetical protein
VKAIRKALRNLGQRIGRAIENLIDSLLGGQEPTPELVPIPVRNQPRRYR